MQRSGAEILLEALAGEGVRHVFGNPGTTELPLVDALSGRDDPQYVLALQEATAVGMADAYARLTGRPSFVNLHTVAGLANGLGNLTNAAAAGTPMVVTAGQQDRRHLIAEPLLSGDLVGLARSLVKWSHEVRTLGELGTTIRRAFRLAAAPPTGPVFLGIPMDVLEEAGEALLPARSEVDDAPTGGSLGELADLLAGAERPGLVVGNELARSDGLAAAVELAEALGAPVHGQPLEQPARLPVGASALARAAADGGARDRRRARRLRPGARARRGRVPRLPVRAGTAGARGRRAAPGPPGSGPARAHARRAPRRARRPGPLRGRARAPPRRPHPRRAAAARARRG